MGEPLPLEYLRGLLGMLREHQVSRFTLGDLNLEMGVKAPVYEPDALARGVKSLDESMWEADEGGFNISHTDEVYDNPRTYASGRVPPFPKLGDALPKEPTS
jgi:hypothetical protein